MLRKSLRLLADAAPAAGAATGGNTTTAGGRLIAIRKKAKWIDRRSKRIPHGGKDVWNFGDQPSCALCHVRFRFKQDYQAHKESELHTNRVRWAETQAWWNEIGLPAYNAKQDEEWAWFRDTVLPKKAAEEGLTVQEALVKYRRASVRRTPRDPGLLQPPMARTEIKEPKDQRWPSSPKW